MAVISKDNCFIIGSKSHCTISGEDISSKMLNRWVCLKLYVRMKLYTAKLESDTKCNISQQMVRLLGG